MSDLNDNASVAPATQAVEAETTQVESQQPEKTAEAPETKPEAQEAQERMVPISVVQKERKERQELQRKLAEFENRTKLSQYSEDDQAAVMNHPFVQELLIKQAKYELNEFAKGALDEHPEIPDAVKKAMLANVRGFVKETTTDVESAKIDIQEWIDSYAESFPQEQPKPKAFPVAPTQAKEVSPTARPLDVQKIMEKPIDEWSDDEARVVEQYKKSMPKR